MKNKYLSITTFYPLIAIVFTLAFLIITKWYKEGFYTTAYNKPDFCTNCHISNQDPSASHPVSVFGCYSCHLGNPFARDKKEAHAGMIKNPGKLSTVSYNCGKLKFYLIRNLKIKYYYIFMKNFFKDYIYNITTEWR